MKGSTKSIQWAGKQIDIHVHLSNHSRYWSPLEQVIREEFLPVIILDAHFSLKLNVPYMAISSRMVGLGVTISSLEAEQCFLASMKATVPTVALISHKGSDAITFSYMEVKPIKSSVNKTKLTPTHSSRSHLQLTSSFSANFDEMQQTYQEGSSS